MTLLAPALRHVSQPIMENTQRDPSSPWKTPSGEWRLRTYNQHVYAAASDEVRARARGLSCPHDACTAGVFE